MGTLTLMKELDDDVVFQTHETNCNFVGVKCTNKDCTETFLKKDLNNHVNNKCPKRKVECHHCKRLFVWCLKQVHF